MVGVEIKGFDKIKKNLDDMAYGLTKDGIDKYCNKIKNDAQSNCGLNQSDLKLEAKNEGKNVTIDFSTKPSNLECVKKMIQKNLSSMPITTKPLFEHLIKMIEQKMAEK